MSIKESNSNLNKNNGKSNNQKMGSKEKIAEVVDSSIKDEFKSNKNESIEDAESDPEPDDKNERLKYSEIEKRSHLNDEKTSPSINEQKATKKQILVESVIRELPKELKTFLLWINISAIVLSVIYFTITLCHFAIYNSDKFSYTFVLISMIASIVGQILSLYGTIRLLISFLAISIFFLLTHGITAITVIFIHSNYMSEQMSFILVLSIILMVVFIGICVTTIVLSSALINKIRLSKKSSSRRYEV